MAVTSVDELTVDELKDLIHEVVRQTIIELLGDPDAGLELREEFKLELQHSLEAVRADGETRTAYEVANKLGLEW
jgi:hypothetical protein